MHSAWSFGFEDCAVFRSVWQLKKGYSYGNKETSVIYKTISIRNPSSTKILNFSTSHKAGTESRVLSYFLRRKSWRELRKTTACFDSEIEEEGNIISTNRVFENSLGFPGNVAAKWLTFVDDRKSHISNTEWLIHSLPESPHKCLNYMLIKSVSLL